jgi:hypothetical protein
MILFAVKCSRDPRSLVETDFANLRQHGLKESEILEIIAMAALAVYANIIADATGMDDDEMFNKISPPQSQAIREASRAAPSNTKRL